MPLLSVCCRDMPCVRIDLFIGKDSERVLNGFIPETGQRFTHDYLHRSAANSPCSIENAITYSVLLFYFKSVPEGSFFIGKVGATVPRRSSAVTLKWLRSTLRNHSTITFVTIGFI